MVAIRLFGVLHGNLHEEMFIHLVAGCPATDIKNPVYPSYTGFTAGSGT